MPRPQRKRTIYQIPECRDFIAKRVADETEAEEETSGNESAQESERITLTLDEVEALRLMDMEGLDQTGCAHGGCH